MNIIISNSSREPIYEQIYRQIKNNIILGVLKPGELLPSIRNLARELQISAITSKRAYEELEQDSFIVTVPGKGSYVAEQSADLLKEKRMRLVEEKMMEVVADCKLLDISLVELHAMLDLLYAEV